MVTILSVGLIDESGTEQERCTSPLMCTEQAPHCAMPQPNLVPVRPICSRITHSSGVSGSACTSRFSPLTLSIAMRFLRGSRIVVAHAPACGWVEILRTRQSERRAVYCAAGNGGTGFWAAITLICAWLRFAPRGAQPDGRGLLLTGLVVARPPAVKRRS